MNIKGMDKEMRCRGFQFKVGKEYKKENNGRPLELCSDTVFHYCKTLQQVHNFYSCYDKNNRYFEIEVLGEEITDGDKWGSDHIRIVREIVGDELKEMMGLTRGNSGLFNSGNRNSGCCNSCYGSNGVFCNEDDKNIRIFNKPSGMSLKDFWESIYWYAICSAPFNLTEWIEYTQEEKKADPQKKLVGGHLRTYTMEKAWANWWNELTDENKEIIKQIPNFDPDVFEDITGIEI